MNPTEKALAAGAHILSEWYNDNAPIGEERYREPAKQVFEAMAKDLPLIACSEAIRNAILRGDRYAAGLACGLASLAKDEGITV